MSLFIFPFKRLTYPGVDNPRYVDDIQAANEQVNDGLAALAGLGPTDFAIFAGMAFDASTAPGTYSPGIIFLNGQFLVMTESFTEGIRLANEPLSVMNKAFPDTVVRPIYNLMKAIIWPGDGPDTTPLFQGNMNAYRMDLKTMLANVSFLLSVVATLGTAATKNVGTIAGTVAAGDDARFGYTIPQIENLFAKKTAVILKGDTLDYTPASPLDPANKKYVDLSGGKRLASGTTNVGDIPTGGTTMNISFGQTLTTVEYIVLFSILSQGTPTNDATLHAPAQFAKTATSVSVRFQEGVGLAQNIALDWIVFAK